MSKFSSKLSRYNTICCEQVMPVPVIPICAVSCCLPRPICEFKEPICYVPECYPQELPQPEIQTQPIQIQNYYEGMPEPQTGSILTISSTVIPSGYLAANGAEVSRLTYAALFFVIGTQYGEGDGSTTFNLPNLLYDSSDCVITYIIKT